MTNFEKIKEIAKEVYTVGHRVNNACKGCPFEDIENCDFVRCSGSATVEKIATEIEKEYIKQKIFVQTIEDYEVPIPILDEVEKEYLKTVLAPWLNKYKIGITKYNNFNDTREWLEVDIYLNDDITGLSFPSFPKKTMYVGMELDKEYTPKELGLK